MELISIILPYYKKRKFISKTINSIKKQTYKKFELLIIYDDQDLTDLIFLKKITKKDNRIKIILNSKNIGAGYSRNVGINNSKGSYLAFLDSDDIWKKNKIFDQLNFMKKNKYNITHTSYIIIDKDNNKIGSRHAKNLELKDLLRSCDIGLSTVMIKKKTLKKFRFPNIETKEDYVFWLKLARNNNKFFAINKNLVLWRKLPNSLSSSLFKKIINGYKVYRVHLKQNILKSLLSLFVLSINYLKKND